MATQSLYRRYRPRRFGELKGQEHVVRALRNAVANDRGGQAYLFSGPRGTGKTSAARILAKVLNCTNPDKGEPCCECESCLAIERGTSFDVLELDAASNNGVDNIRELIERAAMGNPGRHRVFILDEVHMLSGGAEAALLKTLEEPPPHVVFVLATTDPQKVSETIRSRTQHLQFRLLPAKDLEAHVRWVVNDAKLDVSPEAIRQVVEQGGGSARDTLSALELVAAGGGEAEVFVRPEDVIESLINHDAAAVLTQVGSAMQRGHDPKAFTEQIVRFLREMFLSSMAPQLVQLAEDHAEVAADMTARYGIASVVRAIEVLGEALLDIRRAPDPRLVLEVTLVRLASNTVANDTASLLARVERLESGTTRPRDVTGPIPRPRLTGAAPSTPPQTPRASRSTSDERPASPSAAAQSQMSAQPKQSATSGPVDDLVAAWPGIVRTLKATVRALYSAVEVVGLEADTLVVAAPSEMHRKKCVELQEPVRAALTAAATRPIALDIRVAAPRQAATVSAAKPVSRVRQGADDHVDTDDEVGNGDATESVVDQIAKSFPGARIVDTKK
ncbi:MAG: polymerase gamma/tau subunit [Actinomycetota bacterium]|jgi:DNA polymerase-3 subunit gamma/tau